MIFTFERMKTFCEICLYFELILPGNYQVLSVKSITCCICFTLLHCLVSFLPRVSFQLNSTQLSFSIAQHLSWFKAVCAGSFEIRKEKGSKQKQLSISLKANSVSSVAT